MIDFRVRRAANGYILEARDRLTDRREEVFTSEPALIKRISEILANRSPS